MLSKAEHNIVDNTLRGMAELKSYCEKVKLENNDYALDVFIELTDSAISSLEVLNQHKKRKKKMKNKILKFVAKIDLAFGNLAVRLF